MRTVMSLKYKKKRKTGSLSHLCLVVLLIKRSLSSQFPNVTWEEFKEYDNIHNRLLRNVPEPKKEEEQKDTKVEI